MPDDIVGTAAEVVLDDNAPEPSPPMAYRFLAGGVGGGWSVVVGHPMDTIKVKLQTQRRVAIGEVPLYTGTWDCTRKTFVTEGVRGLYRGVTMPLIGTVPVFAMCFFGYGLGQDLFFSPSTGRAVKNVEQPFTSRNLIEIAQGGALAGLAMAPIIGVLERTKCMLQVANQEKMYFTQSGELVKGAKASALAGEIASTPKNITLREMCVGLYKQGGVRSLCRGVPATLGRDTVATAFYFVAYEVVKKELTNSGLVNPTVATLLAGGMAGVANWLVAIPVDTLKSNLQVSTSPTAYPQGIRSVFKEMRANGEPLRNLYRGLTPALLRAFPSNAACFLGFEWTMSMLMGEKK
eukprot:TRINITY_DN2002_c0_g1_i1.p1 TRINITY_DN2002_c0_g1~~TRINITY_DN2002_c0_g1_i1.p1  ORF type:complete len:404 (+),score=100.53 TRINITY_DN2002_c0_g1_i1:167-1213(+)